MPIGCHVNVVVLAGSLIHDPKEPTSIGSHIKVVQHAGVMLRKARIEALACKSRMSHGNHELCHLGPTFRRQPTVQHQRGEPFVGDHLVESFSDDIKQAKVFRLYNGKNTDLFHDDNTKTALSATTKMKDSARPVLML